ncbi:11664_t:CDS:2 [Scutellospora calospora]|uniref:11664_t:CDS:1 n=1 Tax=Scutellospora calospora TaxID=85575 RepID=A0ACA9KK18_9GLOM|nr:11664_t:CDS:2 [Scutellospora calospora]
MSLKFFFNKNNEKEFKMVLEEDKIKKELSKIEDKQKEQKNNILEDEQKEIENDNKEYLSISHFFGSDYIIFNFIKDKSVKMEIRRNCESVNILDKNKSYKYEEIIGIDELNRFSISFTFMGNDINPFSFSNGLAYAAYTYGKVLIEYKEKWEEARKMFKIAIFKGGYIDAVYKLKEYFEEDILLFYKEKFEKGEIKGFECFHYAGILLADKNINEERADYIMDILLFGVENFKDRNSLSLYHEMLEGDMGSGKHWENKEEIEIMFKANFNKEGENVGSINNILLEKFKKEVKYNPVENMNSRSLAEILKYNKKDDDMEEDSFDTLVGYDLNELKEKGSDAFMGNLIFGNRKNN